MNLGFRERINKLRSRAVASAIKSTVDDREVFNEEKAKQKLSEAQVMEFIKSRKFLVPTAQIFVLIAVIGLGVVMTRQAQHYFQKASGINASLSLLERLTVTQGDQTYIPLILDPDRSTVKRVDVFLRYDPKIVRLASVAPKDPSKFNIESPVSVSPANQTGELRFSVDANDYSGSPVVIAVLVFEATGQGGTLVRLDGSRIWKEGNPSTDIISFVKNLELLIRARDY